MIMGLFGVSEVLLNIERRVKQDVFQHADRAASCPRGRTGGAAAAPIARGSVLGFLLGILPGIGAIIPTFISYALERRLSRHPETLRPAAPSRAWPGPSPPTTPPPAAR